MTASTPADRLATVLCGPFGWVHVNPGDEDDHASMRARQLAGLLALMSGADGSDDMLRLAAQLSAEVAGAIRRMLCGRTQSVGEIPLKARQIAQILLAFQPGEGPSEMLWLAQQLADELVDTVAALVAGGAS
jgi:hypothetical protein